MCVVGAMKLQVKVIPKASSDAVVGYVDGVDGEKMLKVKTCKPPEDGEANKAVVKMIAKYFGVKKSEVHIVSGTTSPVKLIEISNIEN